MRALVGIAVLLFVAAPVWADEAEDIAVKWAEGLGGKVTWDEKQTDKPVVGVAFNSSKLVTSESIKGIAGFPKLKKLSLFCCATIGDEALKPIKSIKTLEVLTLNNTNITDTGLEELEDMKQLKALHFSGCLQISDKGLESVAKLSNLEDLSLDVHVHQSRRVAAQF